MRRARRGKCLNCGELFRADPRNVWHQRYCSKAACRAVSKAASQRCWLAQPQNQDYFRGPIQVARVRAWRQSHPGYWRQPQAQQSVALQDLSLSQGPETQSKSASLALQEVFRAQPTVLIGLIAHLSDSALQEDIARTGRRLLQLGQDILAGKAAHADQTVAVPAAIAPHSGAIQLGRSAPGR